MSQEHYYLLIQTGRLSPTGETFISPTQGFSEAYEGVFVKFTVRSGTRNKLAQIGVRNTSAITSGEFPNMPIVSKGWTRTSAFFKGEGDQINIGLGRSAALEILNDPIISFEMIR